MGFIDTRSITQITTINAPDAAPMRVVAPQPPRCQAYPASADPMPPPTKYMVMYEELILDLADGTTL